LNRFFQKAFQAAKEIRTSTEIGRGAVSIKSAAVELVGRIFEDDLAVEQSWSSARARWQNPGFDRWSKEAPARF
jgi:hypothetical protein